MALTVGSTVAYTAAEGKVFPAFVNRLFKQDYKGFQKLYASLTVFTERGPEQMPCVPLLASVTKLVMRPDGTEVAETTMPEVGSHDAHGAFSTPQ